MIAAGGSLPLRGRLGRRLTGEVPTPASPRPPRPRPGAGRSSLALAGCSDRDRPLPGRAHPGAAGGGAGRRRRRAHGLAIPPAAAERRLEPPQRRRAPGRLVNPALRPVPQLIWSVDIGAGDSKRARLLTGPIVAGGLVYRDGRRRPAHRGHPRRPDRLDAAAWCPTAQVPDSGPGGGMAGGGRRALRDHRLRRGLRARSRATGGTHLAADARGADPRRPGGGRRAGGGGAARRHRLRARRPQRRDRSGGCRGPAAPGLLGGASPAIGRQAGGDPLRLGRGAGRAGAQRPHGLGHRGDRRPAASARATTSPTSAATR